MKHPEMHKTNESGEFFLELKNNLGDFFFLKTKVAKNCLSCPQITFGVGVLPRTTSQSDKWSRSLQQQGAAKNEKKYN